MLQGTTPTHRFKLPFDGNRLTYARVTYKQGKRIILVKKDKDFKIEGNWISVTLTQGETFLFCPENVIYQLRVKDINGKVFGTKPRIISVTECLDEEVI
jgi:hypothetical protein